IGTFADDTATFATHGNPTTASSHLHDHLILVEAWLNKWKIKVHTNIELWGGASKSNIAIIQRVQSKILRSITNAPGYVSNRTPHTDLKTPYVTEVIQENSIKYFNKLENHSNPLLQSPVQPNENRRLKRSWPSDLTN
ncbi:hypothetical protein B7P43_G04621, partial [Cryptotermes secundus]